MILRHCQVHVLSVLSTLSSSPHLPPPPSLSLFLSTSHRSVTVGLIINFFSHKTATIHCSAASEYSNGNPEVPRNTLFHLTGNHAEASDLMEKYTHTWSHTHLQILSFTEPLKSPLCFLIRWDLLCAVRECVHPHIFYTLRPPFTVNLLQGHTHTYMPFRHTLMQMLAPLFCSYLVTQWTLVRKKLKTLLVSKFTVDCKSKRASFYDRKKPERWKNTALYSKAV